MKIKSYVYLSVTLLVASFILNSCYKDKGNYDYTVLQNFYVDTTKITAKELVVKQFDHLEVPSNLVYDGDHADLDFSWSVYVTEWDYANGIPSDTIARTENLNLSIPTSSGKYYLEFVATNKVTGRRATYRYKMTVESSTGTGLVVLYEKNGQVDCDIIKTKALVGNEPNEGVLRNVFTRANTYIPAGTPVSIGMYGYYTTARYLFLFTEQDAVKLSPDDFSIIQGFDEIFYAAPSVKRPQFYLGPVSPAGYWNEPYDLMVNNGQVHIDIVAYASGDPKFASPLIGDYEAAPFVLLSYGAYVMVFDNKTLGFQTAGIFDSQLTTGIGPAPKLFDFAHIGRKLEWLEYGFGTTVGAAGYMAFGIFRNPSDDGKRYLYAMDLSTGKHTTFVDRALIDLSSCPEVSNAVSFTFGTRGPVAFYAAGNKIYQIKYDLDQTEASAIDAWPYIPAEEKITSMKLIKHAGVELQESAVCKYLIVSTYNETTKEGKCYLLQTDLATGAINPAPVSVYSGFGKIKDVTFKFL